MSIPIQPFSLISEYFPRYFDEKQKESPYVMATFRKKIPKSMRDPDRLLEDDDENACWKAIPSTITDKELKKLESFLGYPLPDTYHFFLRQWHFIELYIDQTSMSFFPNLPDKLVATFKEIVKKFYWSLPGRGFLPFAYYGDWGVACFDARQPVAGHDYPVVLLDQEDGYTAPYPYASNFLEVFQRDKDGLIWIGVKGWQPDPNKKA